VHLQTGSGWTLGGRRLATIAAFVGLAGCDPTSSGLAQSTEDAAAGALAADAADATLADDGGSPPDGSDAAPDDDSSLDGGGLDAAGDAAFPEAAARPPNPGDGAVNDCTIDGAACGDPGGTGLCKGSVCSACADPADDALCASTFGSSSAPYLCMAGVCTPGDCRSDTDCASSPNGPLCGVATPHTCGKCSSDTQCAGNVATPVCNTDQGRCVGGTCTAATAGAPSACPVNPADVCCGGVCQGPSGPNACCPGTAGTVYCQGLVGATADCADGVCTACTAPTNGRYLVDSVHGSDTAGTGDPSNPACAFKTITRALQVIGATGAVINVQGGSTLGPGETFPIVVPTDVDIFATGGVVNVQVPAGHAGLVLESANCSIAGPFVIDGQSAGATYGIVVGAGTTGNTLLEGVIVRGFLYDGILVEDSGVLTMTMAIEATVNGLSTGRHAGLRVRGSGRATLNASAATTAQASSFIRNAIGIAVEGNASISLIGMPGTDPSSGTGTLTVGGNAGDGLRMEPGTASPPSSTITGVVAFANQGHGMHFVAGSQVVVRGSVAAENGGDGVLVSSALGPGPDVIDGIDLGMASGSPGDNDLQEPPGVASNGAAGLCLAVRPDAGALAAAGNVFAVASTLDGGGTWGRTACAADAGALTFNVGGCGNDAAACAGGVCDVGVVGTGNGVDVTTCTGP
jgi:hypothetical protein